MVSRRFLDYPYQLKKPVDCYSTHLTDEEFKEKIGEIGRLLTMVINDDYLKNQRNRKK